MVDVGGIPTVMTGGWGNGDGGGGWGGILGIVLVIALLGGGRGFGGLGGGGEQGLTNDFLFNALNTNMATGFATQNAQSDFNTINLGISGLAVDIANSEYSVRDAINNQSITQLGVLQGINQNVTTIGYQNLLGQKDVINAIDSQTCNLSRQISDGFCATNLNIERSQNAIIQHMEGERIRGLEKGIAERDLALSTAKITSTIIENLQPPRAIPAYPACNPFTNNFTPFSTGFDNRGFDNRGCC